ncbi:MAG TPA: hypothetical protein VGG11_10120 [Xanthobacteraceae bacterium]
MEKSTKASVISRIAAVDHPSFLKICENLRNDISKPFTGGTNTSLFYESEANKPPLIAF